MSGPLIDRLWGPGGVRLLVGDCVVVGLLAVGVIALAVPASTGGRATLADVQVAGKPAAGLDLSSDAVTEVVGPLGATRIEVRGGRVRVLRSPCPRQDCRHGGWIGEPGELLVCLPNQVVIRIPGRHPEAVDAVAR